MEVYLNEIDGVNSAITTMYMSKRSWTREKEEHIIELCDNVLDRRGFFKYTKDTADLQCLVEFDSLMKKLLKFGTKHITMLRYIDFWFTVEGLHRAGQDDWDSHAKRFENRIIRSSTRLSKFKGNEKSSWYQNKILTLEEAVSLLSCELPSKVVKDDKVYVRAENGYILEDIVGTPIEQDTRRGLYMECIPSNFTYRCNLTEFAHVYKERNETGTANPEVKQCCEESLNLLHAAFPWITRDLLLQIEN